MHENENTISVLMHTLVGLDGAIPESKAPGTCSSISGWKLSHGPSSPISVTQVFRSNIRFRSLLSINVIQFIYHIGPCGITWLRVSPANYEFRRLLIICSSKQVHIYLCVNKYTLNKYYTSTYLFMHCDVHLSKINDTSSWILGGYTFLKLFQTSFQ